MIYFFNRLIQNRLVFLSFFLIFGISVHAQSLRINELMALNVSKITDADGDFSDWIEIYNPTADAVDLQDWSITDDMLEPAKWIFPSVVIPPNDYLLVFASGKDLKSDVTELHTNFKLSGAGEYLALANPQGEVQSSFSPFFPEQFDDVSYGYFDGEYLFYSSTTPGRINPAVNGAIVPAPSMSQEHGFFESSFPLLLSCDITSATIYYTTDGSKPSVTNGTKYVGEITISTTTMVRAVSIIAGQAPSPVTTQTFLFLNDVIHQSNTPEGYPAEWGPYTGIAGNAIADYEIDPDLVADPVYAETLKAALKDIPTISLVTEKENFFSKEINDTTGGIYIYTGAPLTNTTNGEGRGWERPVSFEFFNDKDSISMQIDCGISINGGHSRRPEKNNKHSFRLMFKSEYGPSRLNFPVFGKDGASSFNSLILRAEFGNSWMHQSQSEREKGTYQRDTWGKDIQRAMGHPSSHAKYSHLYINGMYWGMYVIAERMDKDFAESYMPGSADDFDVIKDYSEAMDGTADAWKELISLSDNGLTSDEDYQRLLGNNADGSPNYDLMPLLDVNNLIDYMLINFYGSNTDWDHHNWSAMRNRVKRGAGFRFLVWDGEHLVKDVNGDVLNEFNAGCPSNIFQQLRANSQFKRLFADRAYKYCLNNGLLSPEGAKNVWMNRYYQIEEAIEGEVSRWGDYRRDVFSWQAGPFELYTKDTHWLVQQDFMQNTYFPKRTSAFLNTLKDAGLYPSADAPVFKINSAETTGGVVKDGDLLTMEVSGGDIYYTLDGSDPAGATLPESKEVVLIQPESNKMALVPTSNIGADWMNLAYAATNWVAVIGLPGGVGYENKTGYENLVSYDVASLMYSGTNSEANPSCYIRIPFTVLEDDLSSFSSLSLEMLFDDGFVAYINGKKVAEENVPGSLSYNSVASGSHEADAYEVYVVSDIISDLKVGENILAIQALNQNLTSSDFIINAKLVGYATIDNGDIELGSIAYKGEIALSTSQLVKSRTFYQNEWSALNEAYFKIPSELKNLRLTEVNYHPLIEDSIDADKFEFVELKNVGSSILDLNGVQFSKGISYQFAEGTYLGAGNVIVLAADKDDFFNRYGFMPYDDYKGQLDNSGERLMVISAGVDTLCNVRYSDSSPWDSLADGYGYSLVPTTSNPEFNQDSSIYWMASSAIGGSPGQDDSYGNVGVADSKVVQNALHSYCYPNPFASIVHIAFELESRAHVTIVIRDMIGQQIATLLSENLVADTYNKVWNGCSSTGEAVSPGVYFYQITVGNGNNSVVESKLIIRY